VGQGGAKTPTFLSVGQSGGDIGKDGENASPHLTSPPLLHLVLKYLNNPVSVKLKSNIYY